MVEKIPAWRVRKLWAIPAIVCAMSGSVLAHAPPDTRIALLDEILRDEPSPAAYLERADLHRVSGHWDAAERDCRRALALDPDFSIVHLGRARIALDRGDAPLAVERAREYLAQEETADGYRLLARALAADGLPSDAAAASQRVDSVATRRVPEDYLTWADHELAAARPEAALAALETGMKRLGPLRALQVVALEISRDSGRTDDALQQLDALIAEGGRTERWHAERGRILSDLGRHPEAWVAYSEALAAIECLPPSHRTTPSMESLATEMKNGLRTSPERTKP